MTLKEQAVIAYNGFVNSSLSEVDKIHQAGWYKGEWTCCKCGCMIGKNLKSEVPYLLARQHARKCVDNG